MKKSVNLKIKSTQYIENLKPSGEAFRRELELEDTMEILTEGTLYSRNNATYITYEDAEPLGEEDIRVGHRDKLAAPPVNPLLLPPDKGTAMALLMDAGIYAVHDPLTSGKPLQEILSPVGEAPVLNEVIPILVIGLQERENMIPGDAGIQPRGRRHGRLRHENC